MRMTATSWFKMISLCGFNACVVSHELSYNSTSSRNESMYALGVGISLP